MNIGEQQRRAYLQAMGIDVWVSQDELQVSEDVGAESIDVAAVAAMDWDALRSCVSQCTACELHQSRTQTVFGVGNPAADLLIVGEAPGAEEDRRGEPFVGRAGQLLDEMLRAIGMDRQQIFIANILKCRPPNNRDPKADEAAACRSYLQQQISLLRPKVILAVGKIAAQNLLGSSDPVGRMRGTIHRFEELPLIVTYHPAYLLRSPTQKRKSWTDLCVTKSELERASA